MKSFVSFSHSYFQWFFSHLIKWGFFPYIEIANNNFLLLDHPVNSSFICCCCCRESFQFPKLSGFDRFKNLHYLSIPMESICRHHWKNKWFWLLWLLLLHNINVFMCDYYQTDIESFLFCFYYVLCLCV